MNRFVLLMFVIIAVGCASTRDVLPRPALDDSKVDRKIVDRVINDISSCLNSRTICKYEIKGPAIEPTPESHCLIENVRIDLVDSVVPAYVFEEKASGLEVRFKSVGLCPIISMMFEIHANIPSKTVYLGYVLL